MNAPNAMEQTAMAMPGLGGPANEAPSPMAPAADRDHRTAVGRGQVVATYAAAVTPTSVAASPWYATKAHLAAVAQERETGQPGEHRDRHAARRGVGRPSVRGGRPPRGTARLLHST